MDTDARACTMARTRVRTAAADQTPPRVLGQRHAEGVRGDAARHAAPQQFDWLLDRYKGRPEAAGSPARDRRDRKSVV